MFEYQGFATLGVNLNRQKYGPLDISNVFTSLADLNYYLSKGANKEGVSDYWKNTVPYPYAGQYVALVDNETRTVIPYMLSEKADGTFETIKVGAPEVDGETIRINEDGKLEAIIPEIEIPEYVDTNTTYKLSVTATTEEDSEQGVKITLTPYDGETAGTPQSFIIADPDLSDYITSSELETALAEKADKDSVYTKSEVYTKAETDTAIGKAVSEADHLKRKIVGAKEDINVNAPDAMQYIYMVPSGLTASDNKYYEYIVLEDNGVKYVEQVGNWEVDLKDYLTIAAANETYAKKNEVANTYATKDEVTTALGDYATKSEVTTTLGSYATKTEVANTLEGYVTDQELSTTLSGYATKTEIPTDYVSDSEFAEEIAKYETAETAEGKYAGKTATEQALNARYTKEEVDALIGTPGTPETEGNPAVPGTGVYQNIYSKDEVTDLIADITGGESAADVKAELTAYKTSNDAAVNDLTSRVGEVETKVSSLETLLNGKADANVVATLADTVGELDTKVSSIETNLNNYVTKSEFTTAINDINDRLTWKTLG